MAAQVILKVSRPQLLENWFYGEAHGTRLLCQSRENELILGNIAAASVVNTRRGKQRNLSLYLEGILGISSQNLK
ncbi:hypothetical protein [Brasilonema bromeliae]|uniref:Uncharacterized protein n=2 Tax=Bromeliae group (in: Brasilonema) TaxID=3398495 RepID=A0ABX1P346_9CYAN|nr:hypothetical protein [Brasilonema bromeliae SPC951]